MAFWEWVEVSKTQGEHGTVVTDKMDVGSGFVVRAAVFHGGGSSVALAFVPKVEEAPESPARKGK